jgi:hypothetical protein
MRSYNLAVRGGDFSYGEELSTDYADYTDGKRLTGELVFPSV